MALPPGGPPVDAEDGLGTTATARRERPGSGERSLADVIGRMPYRLALAGGWIDQPFISAVNPEPPGSMVVVSLRPSVRYMDRSGMATGTRVMARALWGDELPARDGLDLVRELYAAENRGRAEPSGSQDMVGLLFPGISRIDYDASVAGGIFPCRIQGTRSPETVAWLEHVLHLIPVAPRPPGYGPLGTKRLDPDWVRRLGRTGRDCYEAILRHDVGGLGASMTECSEAWDALLPNTLVHETIQIDLKGLLASYQSMYAGAMYSGCGGGYLIVASEEDVPGSFRVVVRTA